MIKILNSGPNTSLVVGGKEGGEVISMVVVAGVGGGRCWRL